MGRWHSWQKYFRLQTKGAWSTPAKRQQNEVGLERPNHEFMLSSSLTHASMFTFLIKLLHNPEERLLKDEIILR